jgi:hypothetical protein
MAAIVDFREVGVRKTTTSGVVVFFNIKSSRVVGEWCDCDQDRAGDSAQNQQR